MVGDGRCCKLFVFRGDGRYGDRHVGLYASPDNWHTCFFVYVCVSAGFLVTDISGVGWHRAMKFCRTVDLGVRQVISPFGELWPRG